MILNGMGLVSSPLYIFKDFFEGKAVEHLRWNPHSARQNVVYKEGKT
ncbi:MAG: DUF4277 domain-containing protein [Okeania sp. SIO3B5]|nr:DUF4277 domain-containing protein [Okeania sp. SIO3B5]